MSYCINCGSKLAEGYNFCPECGTIIKNERVESYPLSEAGAMRLCPMCGEKMPVDVFYCLNCGAIINNQESFFADSSNRVRYQLGTWKNKWVALLLCVFLGWTGAHKYYEGKIGIGVLYTFTFGLFFIGWMVDIIILTFKPNSYMVKR